MQLLQDILTQIPEATEAVAFKGENLISTLRRDGTPEPITVKQSVVNRRPNFLGVREMCIHDGDFFVYVNSRDVLRERHFQIFFTLFWVYSKSREVQS